MDTYVSWNAQKAVGITFMNQKTNMSSVKVPNWSEDQFTGERRKLSITKLSKNCKKMDALRNQIVRDELKEIRAWQLE